MTWLSLLVASAVLTARAAHAADSLCATVKVEIAQELTLERQAFDARMRINNGLTALSLEDVAIDVLFTDEDGNAVLATSDPNDLSAAFFIRIDSLDGIDDVSGAGTVAPSTAAEIHWLIIPAPGAAAGAPNGKRYFVGATLDYTLGGEQKTVEVAPDSITVKPLPLQVLDYFLTRDVFADDPFTPYPMVEPIEPFTLGVRVTNIGSGVAENVAIVSAQPRIVGNVQGLAINFTITGSSVDDQPMPPTLRLDFGDIAPQSARVGRWTMETTLSGHFTQFSAEFTHADTLGGRLTSLIDSVNTHFLVHDVRVDLPGRDGVRDFLAFEGAALWLYESNAVDTPVSDQSALSILAPLGGGRYALSTPLTAGPMYVQVPDPMPDPNGAQKSVTVVRGDGKLLPSENAWTSKTGDAMMGFQHFLNVFDVNGGGTYLITTGAIVRAPAAPVLQFIPDSMVRENERVSFIVQASDPDGTIPALSTGALPAGATFVDRHDGTGVFDWTPGSKQAGSYPIVYRATDGVLSAARSANIIVTAATPTPTPTTPSTMGPTVTGTPATITPTSATHTPTPTFTPTPPPLCGTTPRSQCGGPDHSVVRVRKFGNGKMRFLWSWSAKGATPATAFGDPTAMTRTAVCLYDQSGGKLDAEISSGGVCDGKPCWRALASSKGFRYRSRDGISAGITRLIVWSGVRGTTEIRVRGGGPNLSQLVLPIATPVVVQLVNSEGQCWEAAYATSRPGNPDNRFWAE